MQAKAIGGNCLKLIPIPAEFSPATTASGDTNNAHNFPDFASSNTASLCFGV